MVSPLFIAVGTRIQIHPHHKMKFRAPKVFCCTTKGSRYDTALSGRKNFSITFIWLFQAEDFSWRVSQVNRRHPNSHRARNYKSVGTTRKSNTRKSWGLHVSSAEPTDNTRHPRGVCSFCCRCMPFCLTWDTPSEELDLPRTWREPYGERSGQYWLFAELGKRFPCFYRICFLSQHGDCEY